MIDRRLRERASTISSHQQQSDGYFMPMMMALMMLLYVLMVVLVVLVAGDGQNVISFYFMGIHYLILMKNGGLNENGHHPNLFGSVFRKIKCDRVSICLCHTHIHTHGVVMLFLTML